MCVYTIRIGIQCLAPICLPTAVDIGWNSTKVIKKRDTARFRSSGVAPISLVKPDTLNQYRKRGKKKPSNGFI